MEIVFEKSLAFTGHRPSKLASYNPMHKDNIKFLVKERAIIKRYIERRGVNTFISGMALGVDMWSAKIVLALKKNHYPYIKLVCAIPCAEQYKKWNEEDTAEYHKILAQADLVHYVSEEPYTSWCMTQRDKFMVDSANFCLAVWNGDLDGGTFQTVKYAVKRQRNILQLHPKTLETNFIKTLDSSKL